MLKKKKEAYVTIKIIRIQIFKGITMSTDYIKYQNIEYVMPFMFCNDLYIPLLAEFFKEEENPVKQVYGTLQTMWAGGRVTELLPTKIGTINAYLAKLSKYNIAAAFTFSNYFLNDEEVNDELSNQILDITSQYNCYYIVSSEKLYKHIKKRYPNAKMVCSVVIPFIKRLEGTFKETEFYNKMLDKYEIVVVRPEWTIENADNINNIISDPNRLEVLINQPCEYNCPNAKRHYNLLVQWGQKKITEEYLSEQEDLFCGARKLNSKPLMFDNSLMQKLINQGIKKYKLQGRTADFDYLFEDIYRYCINPKYSKEEIRNKFDFISARLIQNLPKSAVTML